ncbi:hypothetical protein JCM13664_05820 [Methylothermus subterraneus]
MNYCVFIHTNHKQYLGALVAQYSMKRNSAHADRFDVRIIHHKDYPIFREMEGKPFLRDGVKRLWRNEDLQSFTPLRFAPPEIMGYQGRAVVVDPDIFAVGDIWELLSRDMQGHAILCRRRTGPKWWLDRCYASSVMLLDCQKLTHWRWQEQFRALFEFKLDYMDWIGLRTETASIGLFEPEWNDFDRLTPRTKLLHNTRRLTQPWKTGLPIDWTPNERFRLFPPIGWLMRARRRLFGDHALLGTYKRHPDRNQERLFFGLLKECLEQGILTEERLQEEMRQNHIRHDALEVLEKTPPLGPPGDPLNLGWARQAA